MEGVDSSQSHSTVARLEEEERQEQEEEVQEAREARQGLQQQGQVQRERVEQRQEQGARESKGDSVDQYQEKPPCPSTGPKWGWALASFLATTNSGYSVVQEMGLQQLRRQRHQQEGQRVNLDWSAVR